ncbi:hypothetical protein C2E25_11960 [Geothermobacter hydrogeniphilus]|uniref:AB hydrolase-1 domain-containing protein n=1 Tax=Geothermobacter hydrogeniphilus TaxID=1969733 RepID=A0A2K2H8J1_9BACT|nr:alpha/beta fold hydrolase [Geothermobacter hydrogeniphilus]PNU19543.1 hypothetical protein C2E25_11960 [Geothermobacter hydrogeniphilus]
MVVHLRNGLLLLALTLSLAACGGDSGNTQTGSNALLTEGGTPIVYAQLDATTLPLPNDVTWAADGDPRVDLPLANDGSDLDQLKQLINAQPNLLGLSPNMFLTLPLTGTVDSSTLDLLIFRTDDPQLPALLTALATGDTAGVGAALALMEFRDQTDFIIQDDFTSGVIKLLPKQPFTPGAAYVVVVKNSLLDSNGYPAASSFTMTALKSTTPFDATSPFFPFENLRAAFNDGPQPLFDIIAGVTAAKTGAPWTRDDILVTWTYHTADYTLSLTPTTAGAETVDYPGGVAPFSQTTASLKGLSAITTNNNLSWTNPATGTAETGPVGIPAATLLAGTGIPTTDLGNIYTGTYDSPLLDQSGMTTVTFRLTVPTTAGPWPVVLFQHGITSSKDAALPIANSLAQAGYATLAIDAIFHGERTTPGAASGDGFFTTNLIQDRANLYQAAIDLWEAVDVITAGIDLDGDTVADLDATNIPFIAHSLGSIIGSVFLSQDTRVSKMVLSSPSAILVNVLDETSLPTMQALVSSLGFTPGTTEYYVFLDLAQWLLDPTDATYNVIGGNSAANLMTLYAFGDPIVSPASSKVFLTNLGLDPAAAVIVDPDSVSTGFPGPGDLTSGAYQYGLSGKPVIHSFLLSPLFDPATEPWYTGYSATVQGNATFGSQSQVAGFLAGGGPG